MNMSASGVYMHSLFLNDENQDIVFCQNGCEATTLRSGNILTCKQVHRLLCCCTGFGTSKPRKELRIYPFSSGSGLN